MKKSARLTNWIIEFDFSADPDRSPDEVEVALFDQLSPSSNFSLIDNRLHLEGTSNAFALKMALGHHILRIDKVVEPARKSNARSLA